MDEISGLYVWLSGDANQTRVELRLDVDGLYPQMCASGVRYDAGVFRTHWIARLTAEGPDRWAGPFVFAHPPNHWTYTAVTFQRTGNQIKATFTGDPGVPPGERTYDPVSRFFREVNLEYDVMEGLQTSLQYNLHDHHDRPASLAAETLSLNQVFERAGFRVTSTGGNSVVPAEGAGANGRWSIAELHDAMLDHFHQFDNTRAQWSLWTFFTSVFVEEEDGYSVGGMMFDYGDPRNPNDFHDRRERQGTAIFLQSRMLSEAPEDDQAPSAWRRRQRFWCAVHEMGHAFNLYHSWEKQADQGWIELEANTAARSFMNYPHRYRSELGLGAAQNTVDFYRAFAFRFSNLELTFMRHAPESFVQMGNDAWGINHAFEQNEPLRYPMFELILRANRLVVAGKAVTFEYLEPVVLEMKLTNVSPGPVVVSGAALKGGHDLTVVVRRDRGQAVQWKPFATACLVAAPVVLERGKGLYESLFIAVGKGGWNVADPGNYTIQASLRLDGQVVISKPLYLRVLPPHSRQEEVLAQDVFSETVGKVLAFDGSRVLTGATNTLQELAAEFPNHPAAVHASVALGLPLIRPYKELQRNARGVAEKVVVREPSREGEMHLARVLSDADAAAKAASTLGHVDFNYYASCRADVLAKRGDREQATEAWKVLRATLENRGVDQRVILMAATKAKDSLRPASEDIA